MNKDNLSPGGRGPGPVKSRYPGPKNPVTELAHAPEEATMKEQPLTSFYPGPKSPLLDVEATKKQLTEADAALDATQKHAAEAFEIAIQKIVADTLTSVQKTGREQPATSVYPGPKNDVEATKKQLAEAIAALDATQKHAAEAMKSSGHAFEIAFQSSKR